ncbi:MAG: hypothetical protein ABIF77_01935 [bacterium]
MKRSGALLSGAGFLAMVMSFTLAAAATTAEPEPANPEPANNGPANTGPESTPPTVAAVASDQPLTPRMQEITALIEAERETLRQLQAQLDAALDQDTHLQIIKKIEQLKLDTEIGILEIQLKYARLEGKLDTVAELEEAILKLTSSPEPGEPQPRPAPESASR